jgi:hypothetical protein
MQPMWLRQKREFPMTFVANSFAVTLASATVAWVAMAFTAPAHAARPEPTFKAAFSYNVNAPAAVTYAGLKEQAHKTCLNESRDMIYGPLASHVRWMQRCEADLIGKVVDAIGKNDLTALHDKNRAAGQVAGR